MPEAIVTRPSAGGVDLVRSPADAAALSEMGEVPVSTEGLAARAAQAAGERRRQSFDTAADSFLTFAEGIVDAASLGFLHIPGEAADIRRDVNPGAAFAGEMVGTVAGMAGGPVKAAAGFGRKAGATAAKAVLGEVKAGTRAAIGARTAEGAGEMAALLGGTSIGHQVTDALIEDKPFSAAAVVHEAGLGAVLGGGFSFLSGVFGRAASKYEIKAQGGLLDAESEASKGLADHVGSVRRAWDDALETHEGRLGVLKQLQAEGMMDNVVPEFMAERELALAEARGAAKDLAGLSFEDAINGDPKAMNRWVRSMERYEEKLGQLDDLMSPRNLERAKPQPLGKPEDVAGPMEPGKSPTQVFLDRGGQDRVAYELDAAMSSPERQAAYERLHGQKYEPMPERPGEPLMETAQTETSVLETKQATPRQPVAPAPEARVPWTPSSPPGKFSMSEFSPDTLAGEGIGGRVIAPTEKAVAADNVLSQAHPDLAKDQVALPDGYFIPAADARQNAAAFENFRMKAQPTMGVAQEAPTAARAQATPAQAGSVAEPSTRVLAKGTPAPAIESEVARPSPTNKPHSPSDPAGEGKAAVRRYLDQWYATAEQLGPRVSPGEAAADHIRRVLHEVSGLTGGREVSAGATEMGKALGLEARSSLGATLNDIYAMRKLADVGADASKGVVQNGLRGNRFLNWATRRAGGKVGASVLGGMIGNSVGGPVGFFAGAALAAKYVGFAGKAAGAAGRLYQTSLKAADGLLKGKRASYVARATAGNRPVAYSDRGPIKDPVERIEDLRRVASSPATMADFVARASGDLNLVSPQFVEAAVAQVAAQLGFLLEKAPPIQYDRLGRPMQPSAGALRKFFEAENAVFDLPNVLAAVKNGTVTQVQVEALRKAHAPVYTKIAAFLMEDPEKLARLERAKLRTVEMVLGAPLTPASDPAYVIRQQMSWQAEAQAQMAQQNPTQALKIPGAGKPPSEIPGSTPLPSQSANGRAPGN